MTNASLKPRLTQDTILNSRLLLLVYINLKLTRPRSPFLHLSIASQRRHGTAQQEKASAEWWSNHLTIRSFKSPWPFTIVIQLLLTYRKGLWLFLRAGLWEQETRAQKTAIGCQAEELPSNMQLQRSCPWSHKTYVRLWSETQVPGARPCRRWRSHTFSWHEQNPLQLLQDFFLES